MEEPLFGDVFEDINKKKKNKKRFIWSLIAIILSLLFLFALIYLIMIGYKYKWTGFGEYINSTGELQTEKTLWDWLELLIIPFVLSVGGFLYSWAQRAGDKIHSDRLVNNERKLSLDKLREDNLQLYLGRMSSLILDKGLKTSSLHDEIRDIARAQTLAVLMRVDSQRKGMVIQFLYETGIINVENPVIDMHNADLAKVDLNLQKLPKINLKGAYMGSTWAEMVDFSNADFEGVEFSWSNLASSIFVGANLRKTYFSSANLLDTNFHKANLSDSTLYEAGLIGADLTNAILINANLKGANLSKANLTGAKLTGANFENAILKGAIMSKKQVESIQLTKKQVEDIEIAQNKKIVTRAKKRLT